MRIFWKGRGAIWYYGPMELQTVIQRLKAHQDTLRKRGVVSVSVFGSVARGEAGATSDVDLAARIERRPFSLFDAADLEHELQSILNSDVDLVFEPAQKPWVQAQIDRDRVLAF
ncbi:MAG: nucleotidyltransferase domain-containing protein [Pseudomonadota bacterium]